MYVFSTYDPIMYPDDNGAITWHGDFRVDHEIHDSLFYFTDVDHSQYFLLIAHCFIKTNRLRLHNLGSAKGKKARGQIRGPTRAITYLTYITLKTFLGICGVAIRQELPALCSEIHAGQPVLKGRQFFPGKYPHCSICRPNSRSRTSLSSPDVTL